MSRTKIGSMLISLLSGLLFGSGMIISGMVDPDKVIAFLDIFGAWDPSLAFVMGGALLVFTPFYHLVIKKRQTAINGKDFAVSNKQKVDSKLISGAIIFGMGWGLAGFCPGPVIASISGGSHIIGLFILWMVIGILCANQYLSGRFPCSIMASSKTTEDKTK
nr:YeeE/YedE family protein [Psychromonas sp. RZ22]